MIINPSLGYGFNIFPARVQGKYIVIDTHNQCQNFNVGQGNNISTSILYDVVTFHMFVDIDVVESIEL